MYFIEHRSHRQHQQALCQGRARLQRGAEVGENEERERGARERESKRKQKGSLVVETMKQKSKQGIWGRAAGQT
jgi:hypothetical protein